MEDRQRRDENHCLQRQREKGISPHPSSRTLTASSLQARRTAEAGAHALQTRRQLRVFLLNFQLRARGLSIRDGVDHLAFCPSQFSRSREILEGLSHLALLQEQLGHRTHGNVTVGVDYTPLACTLMTFDGIARQVI